MIRLLVLCVALLLVASCREAAAPVKPEWIYGPGCTLYWTHQLSDSIWDIAVEHVDPCPRVVMDSTLAP